MALPTLDEAHQLVQNLTTEMANLHIGKKESFGHYLRVAQNAEGIAKCLPHLNPEKAYIMGLLHDYGQVDEAKDHHFFHGLIGYQKLCALGYDEAARAALVHSFFEHENITPERYHSYDANAIRECAHLLSLTPFDDYDRLVHLADLMAVGEKATTIERRFEYLAATYRINEEMVKDKFALACNLKHYFDNLCGRDVYDILNIKRLSTHYEQ